MSAGFRGGGAGSAPSEYAPDTVLQSQRDFLFTIEISVDTQE